MTQQELPSTRQTIRKVNDKGGFDELEWASVSSVELSMSAAQAQERGLPWAVTVKCYACTAEAAGDEAHAEMLRQIELAKD